MFFCLFRFRFFGAPEREGMSKRTGNTARRANDGIGHPFSGTAHQKSRASPLLSVGLILVVCPVFPLDLALISY